MHGDPCYRQEEYMFWPVCSPAGLLNRSGRYARLAVEYNRPGRFACMRHAATFFILQAARDSIRSGDIRAPCLEFLVIYLCRRRCKGARGDSEGSYRAPNRPSKKPWGRPRLISDQQDMEGNHAAYSANHGQ